MPQDRFADRLDPATYEDDDEVVGVFETDPSEADALWLSARLFRRLTGVARAYELHALPLLDDPDPVLLNRARCEAVLDEIAFVAERLDDPVAVGMAQSIADYLTLRTRRPAWDGPVTFEGELTTARSCRDARGSADDSVLGTRLRIGGSPPRRRCGLITHRRPRLP